MKIFKKTIFIQMKKNYLLLVFWGIFFGYAQPTQQPGLSAPGRITGSIVDGNTQKPVEYATIAIYNLKDSSLVTGGITDDKGMFSIDKIPFGTFYAKATFIGYETFVSKPFNISPQSPIVEIGKLKFAPSGKNLGEVNVVAEKSEFENNIDKKVYNVDKNITNTGGTATEILQNIPSVTVDMDGKVSLRGSANVTILIDGKPSGLTGGDRQALLQQIPANTIESIEVITNPSAKYDAEGMAGIINIKTKKDKKAGTNGNISVGAGTNEKYNASLGLNKRTKKYNLYGNYSYRHERRNFYGTASQLNYFPNNNFYVDSKYNNDQLSDFHSGKGGIDLFINDKNTLGLSASYSNRNENYPEVFNYEYQNLDHVPYLNLTRNNESTELNNTYEGSLEYKKTFTKPKKELTFSSNYSTNIRKDNDLYRFNSDPIPLQKNNSLGNFLTSTSQLDFAYPINEKSKFETGAKGSYRNNDNDQSAEKYDNSNDSYVNDFRFSNHFVFNEQVYAGYAMYSSSIKKFSYNAGLRAEHTLSTATLKTTNSKYINNYFGLFPSGTIKLKPKESYDLQLGYSRRINRPNNQALNPFTDYSDSITIRTGNPYLKPEFIHSVEFGFNVYIKSLSINGSLYYRHTDNMITRYRYVDPNTGTGVLTFVNFSSSENYGMELTLRYQIGKKGNIMLSGNMFKNIINAKNIDPALQSAAFNWNTRVNGNYKVFKNTTIQLTGMYAAPIVFPNGSIRGMMNGYDVGLRQDILKGKGSLTLNVTDVFNMRVFDIRVAGDNFVLKAYRKRESRVGTLTFSYRFGTADNNNSPRKRQSSEGMDGGGGMDF